MRPVPVAALAACLLLGALALPGAALAQSTSDETPPQVKLLGDTTARCKGEAIRIHVRVKEPSSTNTVVRLDGRTVKRSTRKRFSVRLVGLGLSAHTVRVIARDASNNRFTLTLRLRACSVS